ncbi:MAG: DUF2911 domain-containing protein [Cyanothece sp. SIO1E1]|nr:DUF2911 domain-containing protein [Cyanothece sp. SIO1E1]
MKKVYLAIGLLFFAMQFVVAQDVVVRPNSKRLSNGEVQARKSPMSSSFMKKGDAYARVVYNQPHLRGRTMLGDKEPYGKVWRLGANEATELFITADLEVGGKTLEKGAYAVFAIPEADKWTLIFNSGLGQWGGYGYDAANDVLRVEVATQKAPKAFEAFTIWFSDDGSAINMAWGETHVSAPIAFK